MFLSQDKKVYLSQDSTSKQREKRGIESKNRREAWSETDKRKIGKKANEYEARRNAKDMQEVASRFCFSKLFLPFYIVILCKNL